MKRLLIYNWCPIDGKKGGGVEVYIKNIVYSLLNNNEYEIFYINSGNSYTIGGKTKIIEIESSYGARIKTYEIINAPFMAPVRMCEKNLKKFLNDKIVAKLFSDFINEKHIDIVHFNNLEGLSLETVKLKKIFPNVRFLYSVHNYFPLCSRIDLWQTTKEGRHSCTKTDYHECSKCYQQRNYFLHRMSRLFPHIGLNKLAYILCLKGNGDTYELFTKKVIDTINQYVDCVLAVSNRVKEILVRAGVDEKKVFTSYIGTRVADKQKGKSNSCVDKIFHIIYMGYMREEKGFYFFADALEALDDSLAKRIAVTVVARKETAQNEDDVNRLMRMKEKFASLQWINGYTLDNEQELLNGQNLGVVPVLWEDNLPQVAIEQVAYGVPILVSNLGGAQEICNNEKFVFEAGNINDFIAKLADIVKNPKELDDFWKHSMRLVTMDEHICELEKYYEKI